MSDKVHLFTGWRDIYTPGISFFGKTYLQFLTQGEKLFVILENNVVQNLKLERNVFIQNGSPELIFLNELKNQKDSVDF